MSDLPPPFPSEETHLPPPFSESVEASLPLPDIITHPYVPPQTTLPPSSVNYQNYSHPPSSPPANPQAILACCLLPLGLIPFFGLVAAVGAYALGASALTAISHHPHMGGMGAASFAKAGAKAIVFIQILFAIPLFMIAWHYFNQIQETTGLVREIFEFIKAFFQ